MRPTSPLRAWSRVTPTPSLFGRVLVRVALVAGLVVAVASRADAQDAAVGAPRVALILAAEDYEAYVRSEVGLAEARALASGFEALDFEVRLVEDATNASARAALRAFAPMAADADVAIIVAVGHLATGRGGSFFLPSNAELRRATDLLSRGVAAANLAQIVAQADTGAIFLLTGAADTPATLQGVGAHPAYPTPPAEDVVVVFSGSERTPVSGLGGVARASARRMADALGAEEPPTLAHLIEAVAGESRGLVLGIADYDFAPPPEPEEVVESYETLEVAEPEETGAPEEETVPQAIATPEEVVEPEEAVEPEQVAELEQVAEPEEVVASVEGVERESGGETVETTDAGEREVGSQEVDLEGLLRIERLLGPAQIRELQRSLAEAGHYDGRIDGVIGPVTRAAIEGFQIERDEPATGYLSLDQIDALLRR